MKTVSFRTKVSSSNDLVGVVYSFCYQIFNRGSKNNNAFDIHINAVSMICSAETTVASCIFHVKKREYMGENIIHLWVEKLRQILEEQEDFTGNTRYQSTFTVHMHMHEYSCHRYQSI